MDKQRLETIMYNLITALEQEVGYGDSDAFKEYLSKEVGITEDEVERLNINELLDS